MAAPRSPEPSPLGKVAPKGSDEVLIAGHEKQIEVRLQTPVYLPIAHLRSMDNAW